MHPGRLLSPVRSLGKVSWEGRVEAESGRVQEVRLFATGGSFVAASQGASNSSQHLSSKTQPRWTEGLDVAWIKSAL